MNILNDAIVALLSLSLLVYLLQGASLIYQTRRKKTVNSNREPVSILKPLCGKIDGLEENLESFARLQYPNFEIILGLKSASDSALPVAQAFKARHPGLPVKIVIDARRYGHNPKVNNLVPMMLHAAHDLVLISDDNVRVAPDYLSNTVAEMTAGTGLVYNLIHGTGARRLGAILENLHLNSFIAGSVCFLHTLLRHACVIGKSMLFRRSTLQEIGGLQEIRDVLAEDYLLGRYYQSRGYRVALCARAVENINSNWPISSFWKRHVRWAKMRFWIGTYRYASEWLGNPLPLALAGLILQPSLPASIAFVLFCFSKILADWLLAQRISRGVLLRHFLLTPLKDLLIAAIWFAPFVSRTILWREKKYLVGLGSKLRPYDAEGEATRHPHAPLPVLS